MTQNEQINKQLNEEYDKFLYSKYEGSVKPPKDIIELFKTAILAMPPFAHKINFHKVKAIATTKYEDLTNGNLSDIIKVVLNTSLQKLYKSGIFMDMQAIKGKDYSVDELIKLSMERNVIISDAIHEDNSFIGIVDKCIAMDKFVLCYNNHVNDFRKKLEMKKATLESLSGGRNNGLRIIPQA